jgi:hypothetical protein
VGIGHVFPGYTYPVIMALPYDHWLMLAFAYDEHVEDLKKQRSKGR